MTYHMQRKDVQLSKSVRVDSQKLFPEKLFDVANDDYLFRWTDDGTWVSVVDENVLEKEVMRRYPGFLQIPSFVNLRRLFREYGFEWRVNEETSQYEFHHPCFQKDKPELLADLKTRRKSLSSTSQSRKRHKNTPRPRTRYSANRLRPPVEISAQIQNKLPLTPVNGKTHTVQSPDRKSTPESLPTPTTLETDIPKHQDTPVVVRKDFSDLRNMYWQNEYGKPTFYSGLPPEVWAQAPMPVCPTAVPVNPNSENNGVNPNYDYLKQMYPNSDTHSLPSKEGQVGEDQDVQPDNKMPMQWGWGPIPYFFNPYHGDIYGPMSQWAQGQGGGDSHAAENKMPQMIQPRMPPYWGYHMPWGYPGQPYQDPNNPQTHSNIAQSTSSKQLNVDLSEKVDSKVNEQIRL